MAEKKLYQLIYTYDGPHYGQDVMETLYFCSSKELESLPEGDDIYRLLKNVDYELFPNAVAIKEILPVDIDKGE